MRLKTCLQLVRILLTPAITKTPRRVLRALQAQGKRRLPREVDKALTQAGPTRAALAFMARWLDGEQLSRHNGQWVLNSFLPPFPGAAFDRMFANLLSGRRLSPVSAFLAVTAQCPYDCWHCSYHERQGGHLTTDQWCDTLAQLKRLGASIVGFTGGEPLMRQDLHQLVKTAHGLGMATILFTSGHGFDRQTAQRLKGAGLWSVCVSLDHADRDVYNRLRGSQETYDQALNSLRTARQSGFYTMLGALATPGLIADQGYLRLYDLARNLRVQEVRFVEPMPCGRIARADRRTFLTPAQVREIRDFHVQTNRKGSLPRVCAFNHIESPQLFGCGAGTQHLFIDAAGHVCPCDFTPLSFGRVPQEKLVQIWETMTGAMGNPRRRCFIQQHYPLIHSRQAGAWPLSKAESLAICQEAGTAALPDYFSFVTGQAPWPGTE